MLVGPSDCTAEGGRRPYKKAWSRGVKGKAGEGDVELEEVYHGLLDKEAGGDGMGGWRGGERLGRTRTKNKNGWGGLT